MIFEYLSTDEFNAPDAVATKLNLPRMSGWNSLVIANCVVKRWAVGKAAECVEHLWYSIVCVLSVSAANELLSTYPQTW